MTPEEQKVFEAYVKMRQEMHPMWWFVLVMGCFLVITGLFLSAVLYLLYGGQGG